MRQHIQRTIIGFLFLLLVHTTTAEAATITTYSCLAPQGTQIANYADGVHGIAGSSAQFHGADTVYQIGDNALQCFCPSNGQGVQTNWVNAKNLTANEIADFRRDGWIVVETGSVWGLSNDPYIAKNESYLCRGTGGGTGGGGSSNGTGGSTSGGSTQAYGTGGGELFAPTGSWNTIAYTILMGSTFLSGAFLLSRSRRIS